MSVHMLNYLARHGYLIPIYGRTGKRGKTRYYSYRDLVIARMVQKMRDAGLELSRLKSGIAKLQHDANWVSRGKERALRMLATDGKSLFFIEENGSLRDLTQNCQLTFAFVLDVAAAKAEVQSAMTSEQLQEFSFKNRKLRYA